MHGYQRACVCVSVCYSDIWAASRENLSSGFVTRLDANRLVQPQKLGRGLKFRIWQVEEQKLIWTSLRCWRLISIEVGHKSRSMWKEMLSCIPDGNFRARDWPVLGNVVLTFWRHLPRNRLKSSSSIGAEPNISCLQIEISKRRIHKITHYQALMQLSKEQYARKRIHNGSSVRFENSVTQDNCSASLGNACDAEQLLSWRNFQSAPHNH